MPPVHPPLLSAVLMRTKTWPRVPTISILLHKTFKLALPYSKQGPGAVAPVTPAAGDDRCVAVMLKLFSIAKARDSMLKLQCYHSCGDAFSDCVKNTIPTPAAGAPLLEYWGGVGVPLWYVPPGKSRPPARDPASAAAQANANSLMSKFFKGRKAAAY